MEVDDGPGWRTSPRHGPARPEPAPPPCLLRAVDELVELSAVEGDEAVLAALAGSPWPAPATAAPDALRADLALCLAAGRGDMASVSSLLRAGCEASSSLVFGGMTPLMFAARYGQLQVLELLLMQPGASLAATTSTGHTALSLCREEETRLLVAHALLGRSGDGGRGALLQAACLGQGAAVRALLAASVDPSLEDDRGRPALLVAVMRRQLEACEALLAYGADPGPPNGPIWAHADQQLQTVLHMYAPPR